MFYFGGTYISYTKEKPISMNPFKVTKEEYELNFGEEKNFLKSLIFLIFKGNAMPSKIEDMIVNQTIVEFYDAYFHPFNGFSHTLNAEQDTSLFDEKFIVFEIDKIKDDPVLFPIVVLIMDVFLQKMRIKKARKVRYSYQIVNYKWFRSMRESVREK